MEARSTTRGSGARWSRWTLFIAAGVLLAVTNNINAGGDRWRTVLQADAKGYHAYLPALLVHHDLRFGFLDLADSLSSTPALQYDYRTAPTGTPVNKYWCGTAVMQAPFYLAVHGTLRMTGQQASGHGRPYVLAVCLAAIAWTLVGAWAVERLLAGYGVPDRVRAFTLVLLLFGTNLFYYTIVAPGMSHAYSFALVALFARNARRFVRSPNDGSLLAMGLWTGLIVLVRPVNALALLGLPFLAGTMADLHRTLHHAWTRRWTALGAVLIALLIVGVQPLLYRMGTGHWWVDSYAGEHFRWNDPHPIDILFSYRKGLFLYTPVYLLALSGLVPLWRRSRMAAIAWGGYFCTLVLVLSSWWSWWYGGGFSGRPFVEQLPFFAVPLALGLAELGRPWRALLHIACALALVLCQVQTYQVRYYRIHYEDMDRERYWDEFLRIDRLALAMPPSTTLDDGMARRSGKA